MPLRCPQCKGDVNDGRVHGSGACVPSIAASIPRCICGNSATLTFGGRNYCRNCAPTQAQVLVLGRAG
jgi:hypothetical protein